MSLLRSFEVRFHGQAGDPRDLATELIRDARCSDVRVTSVAIALSWNNTISFRCDAVMLSTSVRCALQRFATATDVPCALYELASTGELVISQDMRNSWWTQGEELQALIARRSQPDAT
jgi:hypothetical protein